jgi:hypothetical protein
MEWDMSMAQWGAFVSSFGDGTGVPATLRFLGDSGTRGIVPAAPFESRLAESHAEVREAGNRAAAAVAEAFAAYKEKKTAGNLRHLEAMIRNMPANMEFAASSLTKHVETVVTKARADIEAMVRDQRAALEAGEDAPPMPQLTAGDER